MLAILSSMPHGNVFNIDSLESSIDTSLIFKKSGRNTGNLLFHHAVTKLTDKSEPVEFLTTGSSLERVQEITSRSKVLIIPMANILSAKHPVPSNLIKVIKNSQCPVIALGLGAQDKINSNSEDFSLPQPSIEFLKLLNKKAVLIACRGDYTLDIIKKHIKQLSDNFHVLGCPSILIAPPITFGRDFEERMTAQKKRLSNGILPRRLVFTVGNILKFQNETKGDDGESVRAKFESTMLLHCVQKSNTQSRIIFQTEPFLFKLVRENRDNQRQANMLNAFSKYSPFINPEVIKKETTKSELIEMALKFNVYTSASQWIFDSRLSNMSISTRLHGTIAPLMSGVPSICYFHDSRTKELCKTMHLPSASIFNLKSSDERSICELSLESLEEFDLFKFLNHRKVFADRLINTLRSVNCAPSEHLISISAHA